MDKVVSLACLEEFLSPLLKAVNALFLFFGMDLLVQKYNLVLVEKFGMFIHIVVNVLKQLIGMVSNV